MSENPPPYDHPNYLRSESVRNLNGLAANGSNGTTANHHANGTSGPGMEQEMKGGGGYQLAPTENRPRQPQGYQTSSADEDEGNGCCGMLLTFLSYFLIVITMPFSLCFCFKIVQEYERAVIFRLGRLLSGGAKGPGIFFIVPCTDTYRKIDLRTISFDVPPQEAQNNNNKRVAATCSVATPNATQKKPKGDGDTTQTKAGFFAFPLLSTTLFLCPKDRDALSKEDVIFDSEKNACFNMKLCEQCQTLNRNMRWKYRDAMFPKKETQ